MKDKDTKKIPTVKTDGKGNQLVIFIFKDRVGESRELETVKVVFKANDRAGIAKILRRYKEAERYLRAHQDEIHFPKFGFRYIAIRYPKAEIWTLSKDEPRTPSIKKYNFCYHFAGFLTPTKNYIAKIKFGYRE